MITIFRDFACQLKFGTFVYDNIVVAVISEEKTVTATSENFHISIFVDI